MKVKISERLFWLTLMLICASAFVIVLTYYGFAYLVLPDTPYSMTIPLKNWALAFMKPLLIGFGLGGVMIFSYWEFKAHTGLEKLAAMERDLQRKQRGGSGAD